MGDGFLKGNVTLPFGFGFWLNTSKICARQLPTPSSSITNVSFIIYDSLKNFKVCIRVLWNAFWHCWIYMPFITSNQHHIFILQLTLFYFFIMDFLDKSSELFVADGRDTRRCLKCCMGRITCPHCTGNGQVVNYIQLSVATHVLSIITLIKMIIFNVKTHQRVRSPVVHT